MIRVIFMGTDNFAVPALEALINEEVVLVCVVTQPDQPKGRGLRVAPPPVKEVALRHCLPVYQPERVKDTLFVEEIRREFKPDLIVVSAFGQILPKAILELPKYGCINLHPSLLPKYRGAAPIQRAIINGDNVTGVTVMYMDAGEDTGDIILQESVEIGILDSADIVSQRLAELSANMLIKVLHWGGRSPDDPLILPRKPQDHSKASYAPKLKKEDGLINWEKSALEIHNLIRGTIPWPSAFTTFGASGEVLKIWESRLSESPSSAPPGTIERFLPDSSFVVATGDLGLIVTTVQPANRAKMKSKDFVNGYRIKVGDVFGKGHVGKAG